jgi:DNA-binding phage protein
MQSSPLPVYSRLPLRCNLSPLLKALQRIPADAWQGHFNSAYYQGDWSGVALISAEDAPLPLAPGFGTPRRSAWWQSEPAWHEVLGNFKSSLRSARLLRLGAGSIIHEHCDHDLGQPGSDLRLHIPLLSPPGVEFLLDGQQVSMQPGECWFLDLSRPHRVSNSSSLPRVHLVLDCLPQEWLLQAIAQGQATTPALQTSGAVQAFKCLSQCIARDAGLAQRLRTLTDTGEFIEATLRIGQELGLEFSAAEVRAAMRQGKSDWRALWRA